MENREENSLYCAYLLRGWREGDLWRYSLMPVGESQRIAFASLAALTAYLFAMEQNAPHLIGLVKEVHDGS